MHLSDGFFSLKRTRFQISGSDRTRYLNSQLSNDLRKAVPGNALPSCLLTAKGKMCAFVWVFEQEDVWQIDTDFELQAALQIRLERYVVSDDVQVENVSDTGVLFHIFGPALSHLADVSGVQNSRLGALGKDVWVSKDQAEVFYRKLIHLGIPEVSKKFCESLRIAQGIPACTQRVGACGAVGGHRP